MIPALGKHQVMYERLKQAVKASQALGDTVSLPLHLPAFSLMQVAGTSVARGSADLR